MQKLKANEFANFFHEKIQAIRLSFHDDAFGIITSTVSTTFPHFSVVTQEDILDLIIKAPPKSCSLDPIATWLLKDARILPVVSSTITKIVNTSLQSGIFPQSLKVALVRPVLKKSYLDPENLVNYRPISNIPYIGKITEKVVAKQLTDYFQSNCLFDDKQSAYRTGRSTETALLKVKSDIDIAIDQGDGVLLLLLDLSSAFDTIDHSILLRRLKTLGITSTAIKWLDSYLTNRVQMVSIQNITSKEFSLASGVPQGSVLGPLLFLCYVQPLSDIIIQHGLSHHCYADDTQLYVRFKRNSASNFNSAIQRLESCVTHIRQWMLQNKLKLNDSKTEFVVFATNHFFKSLNYVPSVVVGNSVIQCSNSARNLGVIFDRELKLGTQISQIIKSSYFHLRSIGKIRRYLNDSTCKLVIYSLILSRLDYCNSILSTAPLIQIHRLQRLQNNAARLLMRKNKHTHISGTLRELHWLPVIYRIKFKHCLLIFKILNIDFHTPSYLNSLIQSYRPARNLRSANDLTLLCPPRPKSSHGSLSFPFIAPLTWNALPAEIRNSSSIISFKRLLKTHFFKLAFDSHDLNCP